MITWMENRNGKRIKKQYKYVYMGESGVKFLFFGWLTGVREMKKKTFIFIVFAIPYRTFPHAMQDKKWKGRTICSPYYRLFTKIFMRTSMRIICSCKATIAYFNSVSSHFRLLFATHFSFFLFVFCLNCCCCVSLFFSCLMNREMMWKK